MQADRIGSDRMGITTKNNFDANATIVKVRAAIGVYADTAAKQMEAEAKDKAPWIDRTSNARNSIQGSFQWEGSQCKIILSGNMTYSPWLELKNEKRYAILLPTLQKNAPKILKGLQKLVK